MCVPRHATAIDTDVSISPPEAGTPSPQTTTTIPPRASPPPPPPRLARGSPAAPRPIASAVAPATVATAAVAVHQRTEDGQARTTLCRAGGAKTTTDGRTTRLLLASLKMDTAPRAPDASRLRTCDDQRTAIATTIHGDPVQPPAPAEPATALQPVSPPPRAQQQSAA